MPQEKYRGIPAKKAWGGIPRFLTMRNYFQALGAPQRTTGSVGGGIEADDGVRMVLVERREDLGISGVDPDKEVSTRDGRIDG